MTRSFLGEAWRFLCSEVVKSMYFAGAAYLKSQPYMHWLCNLNQVILFPICFICKVGKTSLRDRWWYEDEGVTT